MVDKSLNPTNEVRYLRLLISRSERSDVHFENQEFLFYMEEIWKDIPYYEGYFQVSNYGNVRALERRFYDIMDRERVFKGRAIKSFYKGKYEAVALHKEGTIKKFFVHRLVAMAFIPNPDNLPCINHKDENPSNNYVGNLEWCTYAYNANYGGRGDRCYESMRKNGFVKDVYQFTKQGEFVAKYRTIEEAKRKTGLSHIGSVLRGERKHCGGFLWSYNKILND